jgi:molecular chaperone DnaK
MSKTNNIVGIDLGTTFTALAILDELGVPHVVPNADGERITRSVAYLPPGEKTIMVGEEAWNLKAFEPAFVREEVKRKMGTGETIEVGDRTFSPAEISSFILRKLIESAESVHGKIEKAVITVPANFMEKARAETMEAGKLAGIEVEHIVNEPTAAALHYAMHHNVSGRVVVFDLGGGTLDVSLAEIEGADVEIKTSEGVAKLGGRDFDRLILDWVDRVEKEKNGVEYFETEEDREKAMGEAEKAKKTLAKRDKVGMAFSYRGKNFTESLTRETFEELISDLVSQSKLCVEAALDQAGWAPGEVDDILLVGGSTRIPVIKKMLIEVFGKEPLQSVNPDEAVALGAAVYAGVRAKPEELSSSQQAALANVTVQEVANAFYGTIAVDTETNRRMNSIIIKKDAPLPCEVKETFSTLVKGDGVNVAVTQCPAEEHDAEMVTILWKSFFELPDETPAHSPIDITYSYDINQRMKCEFYHPDSGRRIIEEIVVGAAGTGKPGAVEDKNMFDEFVIE